MLAENFVEIFERDIQKVKDELLAYADENQIWQVRAGISNSPGTLCLHLAGNIKHFFGAILGQTGYIRQRELEFSIRNIPRTELLAQLSGSAKDIRKTLSGMSDSDFELTYPIDFGGSRKTHFVLLGLLSHLNYHLGQINYHRRLV
jgi:hypothetical protein